MRILFPLRAIYRAVTSHAYKADERQLKPDERFSPQHRSEKSYAFHGNWHTSARACAIFVICNKNRQQFLFCYNQKGKRFYEKPDVDILFSFSRIPCLPSQRQALSMPREAEVFVKNRAETSSRHLEACTAAFFPFITQ